MRERAHDDVVDGRLVLGQARTDLARVAGGDPDRAGRRVERLEVADVALVQPPVEGLLLQQPLLGVGADGDAHVAEDRRRRVAAGLARALVHPLARPGRLRGRHPVQEHAVGLRARERAHLRPHRRHDQASPVRERGAHRREALAHDGQRSLREAGADAEPQPLVRDAQPLHAAPRYRRARGGRAPARRRPRRGTARRRANTATVSRPLAIGWSFDHSDAYPSDSQRRASVARDVLVEPGGDAEAAGRGQPSAPRSRSSSATHSMWGVCGNMSTGRTLTSR